MAQLSTLECSADEAIQQITKQLELVGLQASRSFDLRSARTATTGCTCAHHADNCDCDLVVLLVYSEDSRFPVTLIAHGHNGRTWLSLADGMGERPSAKLSTQIKLALQH